MALSREEEDVQILDLPEPDPHSTEGGVSTASKPTECLVSLYFVMPLSFI